MNLFWQNLFALAIVLAAGGYLGRSLWHSASRRKQSSCGSCGSCSAGGSSTAPAVVELTPIGSNPANASV